MRREVELISYIEPDILKVRVQDKIRTFMADRYWMRRAIVGIRFGGGWKGVNILMKKGKEVRGKDCRKESTAEESLT